MNAQIITIGDELLIGQVIDSNSAWLGEHLTGMGVRVDKIISISDNESEIVGQLESSTKEADVVIVSGGLGPTKDDITKESIAKFLGVEMQYNHDVYSKIVAYLRKQGREVVDTIHVHSYFPADCVFLQNNMGTAPGMVFKKNDCMILSVPGVPYEMKFIMENEGFDLIRALSGNEKILQRTILTVGEFEARLASRIKDITDNMPKHISIAFLPNLNQVRLRLTARGENKDILKKDIAKIETQILEELGSQVFGYGKENLAQVVGKILLEKKLTLSTAESCTGGYLSHLITTNPGSSDYYKGSIISYSNELKVKLLHVHSQTLEKHGAVSEETVIEMVKGALKNCNTDLAVSISGIAGPGGGSDEKPVGSIWIACGNKEKIKTKKVLLAKDRLKIIQASAIHAIDHLRIFLLENY